MKPRLLILSFLTLTLMFEPGCGSSSGGSSADEGSVTLPDTSSTDPANPIDTTSPANPNPPNQSSFATDVLLFNGTGISTSDWQSTENIVKSMGLTYKLVNSAQLNAMSLDQISSYGLMIVPGGHGNQITDGLSSATRIRVRQAVRDRGLSYLGICAGAFVAVEVGFNTNSSTTYGFPVVDGKHLPVYWPGGDTSLIADIVLVTFADGSRRNLVWWGGPSTPEWTNGVVARYSNGKPAISQTISGKGFVIVTGPHPEAPQGWRATAGNDPDGLDYDIAKNLIRAALKRTPLPTY